MHLKDPRTRKALIAFGASAAVVAGGITIGVAAANATSTLTVTPGTTSFTTLDYGAKIATGGAHTLAAPLANATFALKLGSTVTNGQLQMVVDTLPTVAAGDAAAIAASDKGAVGLYAVNVAASGISGPTVWPVASAATAAGGTVNLASDVPYYTYITANYPGTYTFHLRDNNGTPLDDTDDISSPEYTVTVLDAAAIAGSVATTDDWTPVLSVPSTVPIGAPANITVPLSGLTLADGRGASSGVNNLATKLNTLMGVGITSTGAYTVAPAVNTTLTGTNAVRAIPVGGTAAAQDLTAQAYLDANGSGTETGGETIGATAVIHVTSNSVTAVRLAATAVSGSVKESATTDTVAVKTGTSAVTYTATATGAGSAAIPNATVYFTVTGANATVAALSTNGTAVDVTTAGSHIWSVVTDANGVASLTVTSSLTTAGTTYTVAPTTNGVTTTTGTTNNGVNLAATYADPAATTLTLANGAAQVAGTVGSSVAISGKLYDQFGVLYTPSSLQSKDVTFTIAGPTTVGVVTMSGGTFSFTYTPSSTPVAGTTTTITGTALGQSDSTDIAWGSTTPAGSIAISAPAAAATQTPKDGHAVVGAGVLVTGHVYDSSSTPLAYKALTFSGTPGVYFSTTSPNPTDLASSLSTLATSGGAFPAVYAYFTKSGAASISVTADAVTQSVAQTVSVPAATTAYTVTVQGASGTPGSTLGITGTVKDAFGNPATGVVDLSIGTSTLGSLGATQVTANSDGAFSTTFTVPSNAADGTATLTATLEDGLGAAQTANLTPNTAWATNGITLGNGTFQATSALAVAAPKADTIILSGPASKTGVGYVWLTGSTTAGKTVKFFSKRAGSADAYGFIGTAVADSAGNFSMKVLVSASTTYITSINSDAVYSNAVTVNYVAPVPVLRSTVSMKVTVLGGGRVRVAVNGGPTGKGLIHLYKKVGGRWSLVGTYRGNGAGDTTQTITVGRGTFGFAADYTAPGRASASVGLTVRVR